MLNANTHTHADCVFTLVYTLAATCVSNQQLLGTVQVQPAAAYVAGFVRLLGKEPEFEMSAEDNGT